MENDIFDIANKEGGGACCVQIFDIFYFLKNKIKRNK